ncbi:MAG TPA: IS21 family transposase [Anaerolineae bacterium]|nr:IS21 family transposase [Anaerolineae bacterium]
MLTVEERFMIRDWYRTGLTVSEMARLTGYDRKTIRKMLHEPLVPTRARRQRRTRKIDSFVPYLEGRMAEGVFNARKLYGEIQTQGYPGKESQVRAFVHPVRQARQAQATLRFETQPGEQAQMDWGHFGLIAHQGRHKRLYAFVMTLGWSRMMYLEFTVSADVAWFLRCHGHAFDYFGGCPRQILHDNLKTAVLDREGDGTIHWNPRYLDFADYYGFSPRACQPYRAQTKGKVESGIKYVRGNFWLGLKFANLADLNHQAWEWLDTVANVRLHGTTGEVPSARWSREGLQPLLGKPPYDTSLICHRRSSKDCLVSYEGSYYSVPAPHAQQHLLVRETEHGQLILLTLSGEEVARHRLATGRNERIVEPAHYRGLKAQTRTPRRPGATQIQVVEPEWADLPTSPAVEARPLSAYEQVLEVLT